MISETDLAIIHALQLRPRASWRELSGAVGVSAETVAQRWELLREAALAWIVPAPGRRYLEGGSSAFMLLSTASSRQDAVLLELKGRAACGTISRVAGAHDVLVDCFAPSEEELAEQLVGVLGGTPGVNERCILMVVRLYRQAVDWREDALSPGQSGTLAARDEAPAAASTPDVLDARLVRALAVDGRAGWAELADACGTSPQTAQRRVERLVRGGRLTFRCDTADPEVHRGQKEVTLVLEVPPEHLDQLGRHCAGLAECRVSAQVLGVGNLLVTFRVRDYLWVSAAEQQMVRLAPGTRVMSRHTVLRTEKRLGRLLDSRGRSEGVVPLPFWSSSEG
ncbi:Lrp/AsnC family transcriptional regulator [Arthrobacter sp. NPDC090010]|uniref:Lrp/AsnC family transcriptional regulator n=1 Tax=Arthrobacter sp. NPDC090010 TaxID=3363942 RepID=UPI003813C4C9